MRQNCIIAIIGGRGTGKTTELLGDPNLNITGLLEASYQQKHLIIDTLDHPMYQNRVPIIDMDKAKQFGRATDASGYARLIPAEQQPMRDLLSLAANHFYNGTLVLEDAPKYIGNMGDSDIDALMRDSKQKNVDLIMMAHDFDDLPKRMRKMWDYLNIRKTSITAQGLREYKNKVPQFPLIQLVHEDLRESANKFANETIDVAV